MGSLDRGSAAAYGAALGGLASMACARRGQHGVACARRGRIGMPAAWAARHCMPAALARPGGGLGAAWARPCCGLGAAWARPWRGLCNMAWHGMRAAWATWAARHGMCGAGRGGLAWPGLACPRHGQRGLCTKRARGLLTAVRVLRAWSRTPLHAFARIARLMIRTAACHAMPCHGEGQQQAMPGPRQPSESQPHAMPWPRPAACHAQAKAAKQKPAACDATALPAACHDPSLASNMEACCENYVPRKLPVAKIVSLGSFENYVPRKQPKPKPAACHATALPAACHATSLASNVEACCENYVPRKLPVAKIMSLGSCEN